MNPQEKQFVLNMTTKTWSRDSHGLFDYEANQVKINNLIITENGIITRKKVDVKFIPSFDELHDSEFLVEVKYDKGKILSILIISYS